MTSLLYLKHAFDERDEGVVERWAETPTWQYFSGHDYFEHRWPCDPSLLVTRITKGWKSRLAPLFRSDQRNRRYGRQKKARCRPDSFFSTCLPK